MQADPHPPLTATPAPRHNTPGDWKTPKQSVLEAIGQTPMVQLQRLFAEFTGVTVLAKLEYLNPNGSMKDRIGLRMIEQAEQAGLIKPGDTLVEPTSGNTGLGLAMAAAVKGYRLIITMPMKMSEEKRRLLAAFGAEVILTPTELAHDHPDNYIELAKRLAREQPNTHLLNQYVNPNNPTAHYEGTGAEIWEQTQGRLDYFVSGMGTGGTISGVSRALKEKNPAITIVGVDPEGSIYTGHAAHPYQVEGIGYDFFPEVFDTQRVDAMVRVNDAQSFLEGRRMAREEGILAGGSSGSVVAGARQFLASLPQNAREGKTVVLLIHDSGRNYLSKMYNDAWMREQGFLPEAEA
ncbi:MAG: cysteine synthase family protein [Candidatus Melainabacteria bacterium]|nr:cysteine synthase family protein [Candidatus Melainabacteria bacterium]